MAKRMFSGIQPSGNLHIGNYFGAIRPWVALQEAYEGIFCIVNLHAITVVQPPNDLRNWTRELVAWYLASGIDPKRSIIFVQSQVPPHAELGWILQCVAHFGELARMTQFKSKAEDREVVLAGLFTYPTLMAADILLYQTELVPVGEDQRQHVELTRDLADRFNHQYAPVFTLPQLYTPPEGARIMALDNPHKKMSKSAPSDASRIHLLDSPEQITEKIAHAVTDSGREIRFDRETKPGISNLLEIYAAATGKEMAEIEAHFAGQGYGALKREVADALIAELAPVQERFRQLMRENNLLDQLLVEGAQKAQAIAGETLRRVKGAIGLL